MFGRKKLKAEIVRLTYRVAELEERICPCEQHLWLVVDTNYEGDTGMGDGMTFYTYRCKRCGKICKTWKFLKE